MTSRVRRRRGGEHGQTGAEFFALGLGVIGIAAVLTVAVGGYFAATYDQRHSSTALQGGAAPQNTHPPRLYLGNSPSGPYQDCIVRHAAGQGIVWHGDSLGWTSAANPRPPATASDAEISAWLAAMAGQLGAFAASKAWTDCSLPDISPPAPTPTAAAETIVVDGSYTIDPNSTQGVGGCGSDTGPMAMAVAGSGTRVTLYFPGTGQAKGNTLSGTLDASSLRFDGMETDADGTQHNLHGSFSSNAGVTRFSGTYDTLNGTAGCGYTFAAQKS